MQFDMPFVNVAIDVESHYESLLFLRKQGHTTRVGTRTSRLDR